MKASEALTRFYGRVRPCPRCGDGSCENCQEWSATRDALLAAVEREEPAPKATLEQMAATCELAECEECVSPTQRCPNCTVIFLAATPLRKLDEEGPSQMADLRQLGMHRAVEFLRSVGVKESK